MRHTHTHTRTHYKNLFGAHSHSHTKAARSCGAKIFY